MFYLGDETVLHYEKDEAAGSEDPEKFGERARPEFGRREGSGHQDYVVGFCGKAKND